MPKLVYLPLELARAGVELEVQVMGERVKAKVAKVADSGPQRSEAQGLGQAYYEFREYSLIRSHVLEDR